MFRHFGNSKNGEREREGGREGGEALEETVGRHNDSEIILHVIY